jgi:WD40 repeat protein
MPSLFSQWWRRSCQSPSSANCDCWPNKKKEIDDETNINQSTAKGIVWLDDGATAALSPSTDDSSVLLPAADEYLIASSLDDLQGSSREVKAKETCPEEIMTNMDSRREPSLSKISESASKEEEVSSYPDLPVQVLVEMIAPFFSDRNTLTRFSMASKEMYRECRESILYPPWPNTMLNLRKKSWSVAFSPDNQTLAVGGDDGRVRLFDRRKGPIEVLEGHLGRVYAIVFATGGATMVTLSGDGDLRIWKMRDDCERNATTDNDEEEEMVEPLYKLRRQVPTHSTHAMCLAYNKDTMQLASGGEGHIKLYAIPQGIGLDIFTLERNRLVESVSFSPCGDFLAVGTGGHMIHIWDIALRQCVNSFRESSSVHALEYSPDGQYIVAGTDHSNIRVWNLITGDYVTLKGHRDLVWSVMYSPDGRHIASASDDGTVRMWNVASGLCTSIWTGHEGSSVYNVAFSPDGQAIASTSNDGYLELRRTKDADFGH